MDLVTDLVFKSLDDTMILGNAAGHNDHVADAHAVAKTAHAAGNAAVDTGDDVALIRADGQLGNDGRATACRVASVRDVGGHPLA